MDSARLVRCAIMLSSKTIKDLHGILHKALSQAVAIGYLRFNPADACNIPKVVRKELTPLDTEDIQKFLTEIRGNPFEILLSVTLFMGLREGEVTSQEKLRFLFLYDHSCSSAVCACSS